MVFQRQRNERAMKKFEINRYRIEIGQRAADREAVRLVLLSDLHGNCYGKENQILTESILRLHPDLIVMAGDMITDCAHPISEGIKALMRRLGESCPVYYGNGNHESAMKEEGPEEKGIYLEYRSFLKACGIFLLENESRDLKIKGLDIRVFGLEIDQNYYKRFCYQKLRVEEVRKKLGNPGADVFNLLIAHNPMGFPAYARWGADLTVSGHLHGGFMRLPVLGGVVSPQMHLFPKYDKGFYRLEDHGLLVSAGIGNHFPPPRIWNPREVVVADLY